MTEKRQWLGSSGPPRRRAAARRSRGFPAYDYAVSGETTSGSRRRLHGPFAVHAKPRRPVCYRKSGSAYYPDLPARTLPDSPPRPSLIFEI